MRDLRRQALESGKTVSRKAQSKVSSKVSSAANSRDVSRNASRHASDDEDNGNMSDSTSWSMNSVDEMLPVPEETFESLWRQELGDRIEEIVDRKRSSTQSRESALEIYIHLLKSHYTSAEIELKTSELYPALLKSIKGENGEKETCLALKALAMTLITVPSETAFDGIYQILKRTYTDSEHHTVKTVAIHTLGAAVIYGGASDNAIEEIMDDLLEIIESDGNSVEAADSGEVVTAALEEWGYLASYIDDIQDKTEIAIDAFVEQLNSSVVSVQVAAGENIALLYEKSYTARELEDGPASDEEDEDGFGIDTSHVKRYEVYRQKNQLEHKLSQLASESSKRISKKDRKSLHMNFSDILNSVQYPVRGPRYQMAIDSETGRSPLRLATCRGRGANIADAAANVRTRHFYMPVACSLYRRSTGAHPGNLADKPPASAKPVPPTLSSCVPCSISKLIMGAESRKGPPLPAPTETDTTMGGSELESKVTQKSSYSLPSDGSPVTISTRRKKHEKDGQGGLTPSNNKSQTSLLIEYFEGGKKGQTESRRPSVRVKVTPSSKSRSRSANDHIQITERKGTRKPSYTKRIQLSPHTKGEGSPEEGDDNSVHSYKSATEESNVTSRGGGPIEVEIMPRRHGSPLIPQGNDGSKYALHNNTSDISSMPADSFLDGKTKSPERKGSRSLSRGEALAAGAATGLVAGAVADKLRTPSRRRSRSLSRERIVAQKAVEKVRGEKSERRRKHRSRSRSVSAEQHAEGVKSPRRRSSRSHHEESLLSPDSSQLNSQLSKKSADQYSFRSGTSKSSINNPKLLETVEDAIRRLILPELTALKREQSKHSHRDGDRRGSITSGSGISRDSMDDASSTRRLSDRISGTDLGGKPKVTLNDGEVLSGNSIRGRKDKNIDRVAQADSPKAFERDGSEETVVQDERLNKKRSGDRHRGLEAAAAGVGLGALTAAALLKHQSQDSLDGKKERRRRRTKSRSRSDITAEEYEEHDHPTVPPMPLMGDINASEVTRSSILSAETERPHSASQEQRVTPIREVPRGVASPSSRTPTRTSVELQHDLMTKHSNLSRGNLSLHSQASEQELRRQEYDLDEHGRKIPIYKSHDKEEESAVEEPLTAIRDRALEAGIVGAAAGVPFAALHHRTDHPDHEHHEEAELLEEDPYFYQNQQEVPPPLRYVPYGHERRGLSPIQSVSGYTEGEYDQPHRESKLTQSSNSYSSLGRSARHEQSGKSMNSIDSAGNILGNRHDFADVRQGGLTDSELTQDGEYWEEQHKENDRNRDFDGESYRSSDPRVNYKHMTSYTDDSMDTQELDHAAAGQSVRGIGANPDYVHTPVAVESAVASLVNASDFTGSGYDRRGSYASFEDGSERHFTSRGNSPEKHDGTRDPVYMESGRGTLDQGSPSKYVEEYELDEDGRKVKMPKYKNSPIAEKTGLAGTAAGAAALVRNRKNKPDTDHIRYEDRREDTGAPLQKSFKERAMEGQGQIPSPRHSIDATLSEAASREHFELGASGLPDMHDPMPEIGYGDGESEVTTNPSIIQGPIGGAPQENRDHWPGHSTPPQPKFGSSTGRRDDSGLKEAEATLVGATIGVGTVAALAGHSREASQDHDDEWARTSGDRKRDTLITNPYEGTSPIAALGGGLDRDLLAQAGIPLHEFNTTKLGYSTGSPLPKDEGYISSAPNARSAGALTPEQRRPKGVGFLDQDLGAESLNSDPFYAPGHSRHLSGMSHGMDSPIYDSATGNGIDRIQSKDIVALMDHLTVRDAQRSARDTEILVTLVRAAAEMRNSFEDMKRLLSHNDANMVHLLADTEDAIITEVQTNTDKTVQRAINGPRPLPQSTSRSLRQGSRDEMYEDLPTKRKNVFRRALKGLSMKSTNDLGKIEEMLVQLLGEVEGLKAAQGLKPNSSHHGGSYDDFGQEGNYEQDRGYEPEGNAGTSTASQPSQSGHLSIPMSRGTSATRKLENREFSDHRISTVPEGDEEELDPHEQDVLNNQFENNEQLLTPTRDVRGGSAPLGTPPQQNIAPASLSNDNTPRTDKSKKHKSSSSSGWIPRVSRWSETTASTVLKGFRNSGRSSGRKDDQYAEPPSRSGSDLGNYEHDPYGEDKLHSGFSQEQIKQYTEQEHARSLLPPEDPKYKAHRNSLNLQHPQPRPGPTHRHQTQLESQAQDFNSPTSPKSLDWGSQVSLGRLPTHTNRYSTTTNNTNPGNLSPISDGGYSPNPVSGQEPAPARPPKEPLGPERPPKIRTAKLQKPSPLSQEHLHLENTLYSPTYEPALGSSPRSTARSLSGTMNLGVPARKPTGPRSMSSASNRGSADLNRDDGTVRRNKNRDTFGTIASNQSAESETF
ncbi:hypothetical protein B7494_g232 [Chlorociboria aeruginascens]|nr:hypothetical protein B7494_g232 [Chlorociboria aeruginascens]